MSKGKHYRFSKAESQYWIQLKELDRRNLLEPYFFRINNQSVAACRLNEKGLAYCHNAIEVYKDEIRDNINAADLPLLTAVHNGEDINEDNLPVIHMQVGQLYLRAINRDGERPSLNAAGEIAVMIAGNQQ